MDTFNHPSLWKEQKILAKGDYLSLPGQVETHTYLVQQGALRIFYMSDSEEHTIRFAYQNSIFASLPSFFDGSPNKFYIQALRKSKMRCTSIRDFKAFLELDASYQIAYRQMMEQLVADQIERELDLLTSSPLERYLRVFKRSPQLFQEVPAKYIASYLRMTPETLSRLRSS